MSFVDRRIEHNSCVAEAYEGPSCEPLHPLTYKERCPYFALGLQLAVMDWLDEEYHNCEAEVVGRSVPRDRYTLMSCDHRCASHVAGPAVLLQTRRLWYKGMLQLSGRVHVELRILWRLRCESTCGVVVQGGGRGCCTGQSTYVYHQIYDVDMACELHHAWLLACTQISTPVCAQVIFELCPWPCCLLPKRSCATRSDV